MSSFYIPVSALRRQQQRLELLGTNIANINTAGYKAGRMTFVEALGTVTGVTKTIFKQGALEFTGNATDLAIQGNGFFVIRDGEERLYTRSGAFTIDSNGKLVNSSGFALQGWVGSIGSIAGGADNETSPLGDIIIDNNLVIPAKASENLWLTGNLNASLESVAEVWSSGSQFTKKAVLESSGVTYPLNIVAGTNDQFKIDLVPQFGDSITEELTLTAGSYTDLDSLVTEINTQISNNANLAGNIQAANSNGTLKIRAIDGGSGSVLTLQSGTNDVLTELGFADEDTATSNSIASGSTELNDLMQTATNLSSGDTFTVEGINTNAESISGVFTYGSGNDGMTLNDLLTTINTVYSGYSTAELVDGKIVLTDDETGDSETNVGLTAGTGNVGELSIPSFANSVAGYTGKTSTSSVIYDSLGKSHSITVEFVKTENSGEWVWNINCSGDEAILSGGSGKATFDLNGNLVSFSYDGGVNKLSIDPRSGANEMNIMIHGGSSDGYNGISQFDSVSTLLSRDQDGRKSGTLKDFYIDSEGAVIGLFTNGEDLKLAQVALAQFSNPGGLLKANGSNFIATSESGIPQIDAADNLGASIESGSLEVSTVDMADQFTKMIEAQRAFQAAARVITTFDQILEETTRLKR